MMPCPVIVITKLAGCPLAITNNHSELHQVRIQSKIYALTPHQCAHCTRMPHLIWSRNNSPTGKRPRVFEVKTGEPVILASAASVRCQPSICHDNLGKTLRVVLSQLDKRAISEGAGKPHEYYLFECVIATFNDR